MNKKHTLLLIFILALTFPLAALTAGHETGDSLIYLPLIRRPTPPTTRVSIASDGTEGNNASGGPSISADGRFVAFASRASNLVAGDTNQAVDVFVHDRLTGETTRVSVASDGTEGNDHSNGAVISADGRFVAFSSGATNLVPNDTNRCLRVGEEIPCGDIFIHDRQTSATTRVSVASDGTESNDRSSGPRISADGRFVAFSSAATNLVPGDTNASYDAFVHDRFTGTTTRVSIASDGTEGNDNSGLAGISADGRFVSFSSVATNLVPGDTNGWNDAFVHDRITGATTRVSIASDGTEGNDNSGAGSISADGRFVVVSSAATNLVPGDTNDLGDIFVHDRQLGVTTRVSVASDGAQANDYTAGSGISADGRFVTFLSFASTLVPDDTNVFCFFQGGNEYCRSYPDIFVHDRQTGETTRASIASDGAEANHGSWSPAISADGRFVAFDSSATNLVPGDTNDSCEDYVMGVWLGNCSDIFVRDRGPD